MKSKIEQQWTIGVLIVTAFDEAASFSSDPAEVARLDTAVVGRMLHHAHRPWTAPGDALVDVPLAS